MIDGLHRRLVETALKEINEAADQVKTRVPPPPTECPGARGQPTTI